MRSDRWGVEGWKSKWGNRNQVIVLGSKVESGDLSTGLLKDCGEPTGTK